MADRPVKRLLILLILLALGLAGVAYYTKHSAGHNGEEQYPTARMDFGNLNDIISVSAMLRPLDAKPVFTMISGQVVEVRAENGAEVTEGDVLARLDDRKARREFEKANGILKKAIRVLKAAETKLKGAKALRADAERLVEVVKDKGGSGDRIRADLGLTTAQNGVTDAENAIEVARADVESATALVAEAELGVKLTTITVPFIDSADGQTKNPTLDRVQFEPSGSRPKRKFKVLSRKVQPGQNVDTKEPLFILAAGLEQMQAHALIPESQ